MNFVTWHLCLKVTAEILPAWHCANIKWKNNKSFQKPTDSCSDDVFSKWMPEQTPCPSGGSQGIHYSYSPSVTFSEEKHLVYQHLVWLDELYIQLLTLLNLNQPFLPQTCLKKCQSDDNSTKWECLHFFCQLALQKCLLCYQLMLNGKKNKHPAFYQNSPSIIPLFVFVCK